LNSELNKPSEDDCVSSSRNRSW